MILVWAVCRGVNSSKKFDYLSVVREEMVEGLQYSYASTKHSNLAFVLLGFLSVESVEKKDNGICGVTSLLIGAQADTLFPLKCP